MHIVTTVLEDGFEQSRDFFRVILVVASHDHQDIVAVVLRVADRVLDAGARPRVGNVQHLHATIAQPGRPAIG